MKTTLLLSALLALAALTSTLAAVTGRSADTSLAGTEKVLSDSSGTDTYITITTLRDAMVLTGGLTASGSTAFDFSGSTGAFKTSTGIATFGGSAHNFSAVLQPTTNDAAALGTATLSFSDLFLASGGVVNFNNGNWVATHTSGILTVGTGDLRVTTAGTHATSVVTISGTQTLTNKTLTSPTISSATLSSPTMTTPTLGAAIATSIETLTSGLIFEGATADAFETTLNTVDPTADQTVTLPNFASNFTLLGSTLTTNALSAANSFWGASNALVFEGATADASEISLTPADATEDVTYLLPNAAAASYSVMSSTLTTNAPDIANSVTGASAALVFEGTADSFETSLTVTDPTADRTITFSNTTGTVDLSQSSTSTALTADNQAVTPGVNSRLQLTSDNATAASRTFTLSATGAITGQIYVIIGPATNACEIADTGIQKLSAAWEPGATDALTVLFDGTNFIELSRADN